MDWAVASLLLGQDGGLSDGLVGDLGPFGEVLPGLHHIVFVVLEIIFLDCFKLFLRKALYLLIVVLLFLEF